MLLLLGTLFAAAHWYLNSPRFQQELIAEISRQIQCEVRLEKIKIRLLRGIDLVGIRLSSDKRRPRDFLQAERLRLRYNVFAALFHRKIVIEELKLSSPSIKLDLSEPVLQARDHSRPEVVEEGPRLENVSPEISSAEQPLTSFPVPVPAKTDGQGAPATARHFQDRKIEPPSVDLRNLVIEDGSLSLILPDGEKLILHGARIQAAFSTHPLPNGMGSISCPLVDLSSYGRGMEISEVKLDFLWHADGLEIPRLSAALWGGVVEGKFNMDATRAEWPFEMSLAVRDVNMSELSDASEIVHPIFDGRLHAQTKFQGSMLEPLRASGSGQARILHAKLVNTPVLSALGNYLDRPDFRNLPLEKCELDFMLQNGALHVAQLWVVSSDIEVCGQGWIKLAEQTQEFQMKTAFSTQIALHFPSEMIDQLDQRDDGRWEKPFRTWGSLKKPQTDLQDFFRPMAARIGGGDTFEKIFRGVKELSSKKKNLLPPDE